MGCYRDAVGLVRSLKAGRFAVRCLIVMAVTLPWLARGSVDARLAVGDYQIIGEALYAADIDEWSRAVRLMDGIDDPLASKFFRWLALVEDLQKASFDDLARFIIESPAWPRIDDLQTLAESRLTDSADQALTLQLFESRKPATTRGQIRFAEALFVAGRQDEAVQRIKLAWTHGEFTKREEKSFLERHQRHLSRYDHEFRLENMLWERRWSSAKRMLPRVSEDHQRLAKARLALQQRSPGVDSAIAGVPASFEKDPGLSYDRVRWRRQKQKHQEAINLLLDPPEQLGRPDRWWYERSYQIRRAIDRREFATAYRLASRHGQLRGGDYAEAEWLAGWLALRFNKRPKTAFRHFVRLYDRVVPPVRQARAAYWAGRAADAQGDDAGAVAWYRRAASHHVAYYGQLAAGELSEKPPVQKSPDPTRSEHAAFSTNEVAQVARMLIAAGAANHLDAFLFALSDQAETPAEIGMIAELAVAVGRPNLLAQVGRKAAFAGKVYGPAAFPVPHIVGLLNPAAETVEPPLLLGLARQESMFRNSVASNAGAHGLMQLLPSTARLVARRAGKKYDADRLIGDPDYNAMLGGYYLETMLERFDGEPVLALTAYNAGPLRVKQWIEKHGDPRTGNAHDMIDWVELIPFVETRNYVQRVLEGYQVYKHRLTDRNIALIDFPGGNGFGPPPIPMPKPRDEAVELTHSAGVPGSAISSHQPLFRLFETPSQPTVKITGDDADSADPRRKGDTGKTAKVLSSKTFNDQERQRLAADDGKVIR